MTLEEAMATVAWSPLRLLSVTADEVLPRVYKIADNCYVHALPYTEVGDREKPGAPFVTRLYWTDQPSALRRVVAREGTIATRGCDSLPHALAQGTSGQYRGLKSIVGAKREKIAETARYNLQGEFLCRDLTIPPFTYSFESLRPVDSAFPCLTSMRLRSAN